MIKWQDRFGQHPLRDNEGTLANKAKIMTNLMKGGAFLSREHGGHGLERTQKDLHFYIVGLCIK